MILYLSSKEHPDILDFLTRSRELFIKKFVGNYNIHEFLTKSISRMGHIDMIVIDRTCINENDDELIDALEIFKSISKMKIAFYMPVQNKNLVQNLIGLGFFNIISKVDIEDIKKEIEMCVLDDMTEDYIKQLHGLSCETKIIPEDRPCINLLDHNIKIGVVGTMNRIGTTTIAIKIANYLISFDGDICYVEVNASNHMEAILGAECDKNEMGYYKRDNVDYMTINENSGKKYNAIIFDLGIAKIKAIKALNDMDIVIIVAGNKPHEISFYNELKDEFPDGYNVIFNLSKGTNSDSIYYGKYESELYDYDANTEIFADIITKNLKEQTYE